MGAFGYSIEQINSLRELVFPACSDPVRKLLEEEEALKERLKQLAFEKKMLEALSVVDLTLNPDSVAARTKAAEPEHEQASNLNISNDFDLAVEQEIERQAALAEQQDNQNVPVEQPQTDGAPRIEIKKTSKKKRDRNVGKRSSEREGRSSADASIALEIERQALLAEEQSGREEHERNNHGDLNDEPKTIKPAHKHAAQEKSVVEGKIEKEKEIAERQQIEQENVEGQRRKETSLAQEYRNKVTEETEVREEKESKHREVASSPPTASSRDAVVVPLQTEGSSALSPEEEKAAKKAAKKVTLPHILFAFSATILKLVLCRH